MSAIHPEDMEARVPRALISENKSGKELRKSGGEGGGAGGLWEGGGVESLLPPTRDSFSFHSEQIPGEPRTKVEKNHIRFL